MDDEDGAGGRQTGLAAARLSDVGGLAYNW
jgi:hypothetical protein